jgi:3-hydroxybutyryl-CoA dehydratase
LSAAPTVLRWTDLRQGMSVQVPFRISQADMDAFGQLSGDLSRIHLDESFAQRNGFTGPVVYGALVVARLSNLVGMHLPGDLGLATDWKINFNRPLYVDETAVMAAEITHLSPATRTVTLRFRVSVDDKLVASGTAGSKLLDTPEI